ncbi:MAG: PEGA domain-containing protein, partial [Chitinispirillia bacterium]
KPSILKITSEPSSSIVYLNKKNVGLTPFISKELKKGSYNLILLKEGYQKSEQNLELEAGTGDSLHIVLKLKPNVNPDTAEAPDTVEAKEELQKKEDTKLRSVLDKIALGIFAGFSLIILLIELSQDN